MRNSSATKSLAVALCLGMLILIVTGCSSPGTKATGSVARVGEAVNVDNLKFTVTGAETAKTVGATGNTFELKDGKYVVVEMDVENVGTKEIAFDGEMAKLYDANKQLYEMNLEASASCCKQETTRLKNVWFGKLQPGEKATTRAVFEVPAGTKGLQVELRSANIGSEKTALVSLGI